MCQSQTELPRNQFDDRMKRALGGAAVVAEAEAEVDDRLKRRSCVTAAGVLKYRGQERTTQFELNGNKLTWNLLN